MTALAKLQDDGLAQILDEIARDDLALAKTVRKARALNTYEQGLEWLQGSPAEFDKDTGGIVREAVEPKTEQELAAMGWTRDELRVATHGMLPPKETPTYLARALDRVEVRSKGSSSSSSPAPVTIIGGQVAVAFTREQLAAAPVIDVNGVK